MTTTVASTKLCVSVCVQCKFIARYSTLINYKTQNDSRYLNLTSSPNCFPNRSKKHTHTADKKRRKRGRRSNRPPFYVRNFLKTTAKSRNFQKRKTKLNWVKLQPRKRKEVSSYQENIRWKEVRETKRQKLPR